MAAPRKYPDELRERAIRFALDLVEGPKKLALSRRLSRGESRGPFTGRHSRSLPALRTNHIVPVVASHEQQAVLCDNVLH
jgi:hypothetical protein